MMRAVEIRMTLDNTDPPAGTVCRVDDGPADVSGTRWIPFTGWLGMLHALSELIGSPESSDAG
jgi:hypothetical protein